MQQKAKSIRTFIGSKDFRVSASFYLDLGFEEARIDANMSYFKVNHELGFYLQNYYTEEWVNNSMVFLEVENVEEYYNALESLNLPQKYEKVKLTPIRTDYWGRECFLHDPAGVLWHFGQFAGR